MIVTRRILVLLVIFILKSDITRTIEVNSTQMSPDFFNATTPDLTTTNFQRDANSSLDIISLESVPNVSSTEASKLKAELTAEVGLQINTKTSVDDSEFQTTIHEELLEMDQHTTSTEIYAFTPTIEEATTLEVLTGILEENAVTFDKISRNELQENATNNESLDAIDSDGEPTAHPNENKNLSKRLRKEDTTESWIKDSPVGISLTKTPTTISELENSKDILNDTIITTTKQITLLLQKNCTDKSIFPNTLAVLNTHMLSLLSRDGNENVNINPMDCHTFLHLKFLVESASDDAIQRAIDILSANVSLGGDFKVIKAYVSDDEYDTTNLLHTLHGNSDNNNKLLQGEIIAYIIAASSCLFVLLLFITLCCIRCANSKQSNSLDLCDIPHLNLKLEDYKIMPIPRPSISYQDYGRELLSSTYGGSRSGDTLVSHHKLSVDSSSSLGNTLHRERMLAQQELRTFNGKRPCGRVQSLDVRPHRSVSSWVNNSRERLNHDFEKRKSGIDNATYEKWC